MKKIVIFLLCLLFLCGCADTHEYPTDTIYHRDTDYQYSMSMELNWKEFTETEEGFYFWIPDCMFYMDKETMQPMPLCTKPNCLHYKEPDFEKFRTCEAFFAPASPRLPTVWYEGSLYVITASINNGPRAKIVRVSADGSRRQTLFEFDENINPTMLIHRGVMYLAMTYFTEDGESHSGIWAYALNGSDKRPRCMIEYHPYTKAVQQNLTAYGQRLYFARSVSPNDHREFCIYDISTGELTTLQANEEGLYPYAALFVQDKMLLLYRCGTLLEDSYRQQAYRCDLDGGNPQLVSDDPGFFTADGRYIYRGTNFWVYGNTDHYLHIYDVDYNELDRIDLNELPGMGEPLSASYHVSMDDQVLIEASEVSSSRKYYYWFDKTEIGSGNIQVHPFMDYENEYSEVSKY